MGKGAPMKTAFLKSVLAVLASASAGLAMATPVTVWTNNAGTPQVQSFDTTSGVRGANFTGSGSNGRGVVVVGNIVYTTDANSSFIGRFDSSTGASLGGCSVAGFGGFSTIGYDGDAFWTSDYTGGNKAYRIDTNCTLLKTVTLSLSQGFYDGLEYFNGKLIANRFDGGFTGGNQYSVYDTDGNLLQANFIDTTGHGNGTGIAYDGANFWISDILNNSLTIWDGSTGAYLNRLALIGSNNLIEDISFNYEERNDTCRVNCNVPEPASLPLTALALLGAAGAVRKRRRA
jgi:hypothetical protein